MFLRKTSQQKKKIIKDTYKIKIPHFLPSRENCKIAASPPPTLNLMPKIVFKSSKRPFLFYKSKECDDSSIFLNKIVLFQEYEDNFDFAPSPPPLSAGQNISDLFFGSILNILIYL